MPLPARSPDSDAWSVWLAAVLAPFLLFPEKLVVLPPGGMAILSIGVFAVSLFLLHRAAVSPWFTGSVALLASGLWMGWALVPYRLDALPHLTGAALGLLVMAVLARWAVTPHRRTWAGGVFLVIGCAALLVGAVGVSIPSPKVMTVSMFPSVRLPLPGLGASGSVNPNALAVTALMVMPFGLWLSQLDGARRFFRAPGWALLGVTGGLVLLTQSRSAWIAVVGMMAWVGIRWHFEGQRTRWKYLAALVAVPLLLGIVALTPQGWNMVTHSVNTFVVRTDIWSHAVVLLGDSPLTGVGLQEFRHTIGPPFVISHAHNIALQTWLDGGLGALLGWLVINAEVLRRADRVVRDNRRASFSRQTARAGGLVVIACVLFGLVDAVALGAKVGLLQWFASGLVLACVPGDTEVAV